MMDRDSITRFGARAPGVGRGPRPSGGAPPGVVLRRRTQTTRLPRRARRTSANRTSRRVGREQASPEWGAGRPRPKCRPWSRTGENPPYGILGGTMETSASFEARSAPSSYPTAHLREEEEQRTLHGAAADDSQTTASEAERGQSRAQATPA